MLSLFYTLMITVVALTHLKLPISAPALPQATTNATLHGFDSICAVF